MTTANEVQVAGGHYKSEYQHWDFVSDALGGCYLEGQISKYVTRWRKKNGVQDLEKARHFAQKLMESYHQKLVAPLVEEGNSAEEDAVSALVNRYCMVNQLTAEEANIIFLCALWTGGSDLAAIVSNVTALIAENTPAGQ